jgi:hypothetical protein
VTCWSEQCRSSVIECERREAYRDVLRQVQTLRNGEQRRTKTAGVRERERESERVGEEKRKYQRPHLQVVGSDSEADEEEDEQHDRQQYRARVSCRSDRAIQQVHVIDQRLIGQTIFRFQHKLTASLTQVQQVHFDALHSLKAN